MVTPATDPAMRDAAHGLLAADGQPVVVINDSPGFVAQRVVAHDRQHRLRRGPARHRHARRHRQGHQARPRLSVRAARMGRSPRAPGACCSSWSGCRPSTASRATGPTPGSSAAPRSACRCRRPKVAAEPSRISAAAHLPGRIDARGGELAVADGVLVGADEAVGQRAQAAVRRPGERDLPGLSRTPGSTPSRSMPPTARAARTTSPAYRGGSRNRARAPGLPPGVDDVSLIGVEVARRQPAVARPRCPPAPSRPPSPPWFSACATAGSAIAPARSSPSLCIWGVTSRCPAAFEVQQTTSICYVRSEPATWRAHVELRAPVPSPRHCHHRRLRRSHPHRRPSDQGAEERRLQGRRSIPVNPKYPELHGLKCYPDAASIGQPCDLAIIAVPAAGRGAGDARLRQGRHSVRRGADGGLPRDRRRGPQARGRAQARRSPRAACASSGPTARACCRCSRACGPRSAAWPTRPISARARVSCAFQSGGFGYAVVNLAEAQGLGFRYCVSSGNETDIDMPRAAVRVPRRRRHLGGLRLPGRHARRAAPARRRAQVAGDRQAGDDLEGRHHRCRHQGRRLAHRQHDRQLRPLPRRAAPVPA